MPVFTGVVRTWYRLVIVVCKVMITKLVSIRNSSLYGIYKPLISLDHTSEMRGRRGPVRWCNVHLGSVVEAVLNAAKLQEENDVKQIAVSKRVSNLTRV